MADKYWVGGTGNWSDSTHWAAASGGAYPAAGPAPTSVDNAIFDSNSGTGTVTVDTTVQCLSFTFSAATANLKFDRTAGAVEVYGNVSLSANAQWAGTNFPLAISMMGTSVGRTSSIANAAVVSTMSYGQGGTISQSAATFSTSCDVSGATVTFTGAINTTSLFVYSGALTSGAFTHNLTNTTDSNFQLYVAAIATATLTNSTFNIGTTATVADVYPSVYFPAGATIAAANTVFNLGRNAVGFRNASSFQCDTGGTIGALNMFYPVNASIVGANTFSTLTCTNGSGAGLVLYDNQTCTGTFTLSGISVASRLNVISDAQGTQRTITLSSATASVKNITNTNFADIQITNTGSAIVSSSVGDCLGNTMPAGLLTAAVTRYGVTKLAAVAITGAAGQCSCTATTGLVVGNLVTITGAFSGTGSISGYVSGTSYLILATNGTTTFTLSTDGVSGVTTVAGTTTGATFGYQRDYSSTTMWSTASGGASGATAPLPQDTVVLDANTGPGKVVVSVNPILGKNVDFTGYTGYFDAVSLGAAVYGAFTATGISGSIGVLVYCTRTNTTLLVPAMTIGNTVYFATYGATITLSDVLQAGAVYVTTGTFTTSNHNISVSSFIGADTFFLRDYGVGAPGGNATLNLGSSRITASGTTAAWSMNSSTTVNPGTSKIVLTNVASTFTSGSLATYYDLEFAYTSTATLATATLNGACLIFNSLLNTSTKPLKIQVETSRTLTVATLSLTAAKGTGVVIASNSATNGTFTLALANSATTTYTVYRNVNKSGAGVLNARGVANLGNNTGIVFSSTVKGLAFTGTTAGNTTGSFVVPAGFVGSSLLVAIAGGGGAARRGTSGGAGGGAGSMGIVSNVNVSSGQTVYYQVGRGGPGATGALVASGTSGGASWINISANASPTSIANGTTGASGAGANSAGSTGGVGGAASAYSLFAYAGGSGGNASSAGGGGGSAPSLVYGAGFTGGFATAGTSNGGGGGGGQKSAGSVPATTTGGNGGQNLSAATAAGGVANSPGTAGTLGGGGGGGGGALTTTTGGAGATAQSNDAFNYTVLNGVDVAGSIGPSGGGGGGGASVSGTGGTGGAATYGGGGGGAGKGGTTATGGSGGDGGVGIVLFLYEAASAGGSQAIFIG